MEAITRQSRLQTRTDFRSRPARTAEPTASGSSVAKEPGNTSAQRRKLVTEKRRASDNRKSRLRHGSMQSRIGWPAHFRADVPEGRVQLSIHSDIATNNEIGRLVQLMQHEPLIRLLEDWLGTGLEFDFQSGTLDTTEQPHCLFSVCRTEYPGQRIDVSADVPLWSHRSLARQQLHTAGYQVIWHEYHARLCFGPVPLTDTDYKHLNQGAIILLPASFEAEWKVDLAVPSLLYQQNGLLIKDPYCWHGMLDFPRSDNNLCKPNSHEVAGCYFEVSTETLVSDPANLNHSINETLSNAYSMIRGRDGTRACGQLLPVGNGFGLRITQVLAA